MVDLEKMELILKDNRKITGYYGSLRENECENEEYNIYMLRHGGDDSWIVGINEYIVVNHFGNFYSKDELTFEESKKHGYVKDINVKDWGFIHD